MQPFLVRYCHSCHGAKKQKAALDLSLDATVVLLTPVVFATATRLGARPKPHVYACAHLSNTASLLLPVWVQKDWSGGWSAFGGGGCVVSGRTAQDFCLTGGVVTYQLLPKLQLGTAELTTLRTRPPALR